MKTTSKIAASAGGVALLSMAAVAQAGQCIIGGITTASFPGDSIPHTILWGNKLDYKRSEVTVNVCGEPGVHYLYDIAPDGNWFMDMKLWDVDGRNFLVDIPVPLPYDSGPIYCKFIVTQKVYSAIPYTNQCELGPIMVPALFWDKD